MGSPWLDSQAGAGQAAVDQVGPVLDLLQLALDDADHAGLVGGGEVDDRPLEQRPDALIRSQPADVTTRSYEFILVKPRRQSRYVTRLPAILAELCRIVHR